MLRTLYTSTSLHIKQLASGQHTQGVTALQQQEGGMQASYGDVAESLVAVRPARPVALRCGACQGLFATAADVSSPSLR